MLCQCKWCSVNEDGVKQCSVYAAYVCPVVNRARADKAEQKLALGHFNAPSSCLQRISPQRAT